MLKLCLFDFFVRNITCRLDFRFPHFKNQNPFKNKQLSYDFCQNLSMNLIGFHIIETTFLVLFVNNSSQYYRTITKSKPYKSSLCRLQKSADHFFYLLCFIFSFDSLQNEIIVSVYWFWCKISIFYLKKLELSRSQKKSHCVF